MIKSANKFNLPPHIFPYQCIYKPDSITTSPFVFQTQTALLNRIMQLFSVWVPVVGVNNRHRRRPHSGSLEYFYY